MGTKKRDEDFWEEELEEDIYNSEKKREEMVDSDEMNGEEEAFMQGYEEA